MITNRARYDAYIVSDAWRARRLRALKRDRRRCQGCGATSGLHVHHRTYERFTKEPQSDLVTVCQDCHQIIHDTQALTGRDLAVVTDEVLEVLARADRRSPASDPEPERSFVPRHERQSLRSRKRNSWRLDGRNGGTWARQARQRDERASARRANGLT